MNKQANERVAQYLHSYSWLFSTTVQWLKQKRFFFQALKINETVEELILGENGIESFGVKMICATLLVNSTITKLDLSGD